MANTYTQLYLQIVFVVKSRENLIHERIREKVEKYICGIVSKHKSKPLAIYCNPDHLHLLISLNPSVSPSEIARVIKTNSSKWINEQKLIGGKFRWQEGFAAFSYAQSQIDAVTRYIINQPEHHRKKGFKEEYKTLLEQFNVDYKEQFLFDGMN